jgi:hypothetical protein
MKWLRKYKGAQDYIRQFLGIETKALDRIDLPLAKFHLKKLYRYFVSPVFDPRKEEVPLQGSPQGDLYGHRGIAHELILRSSRASDRGEARRGDQSDRFQDGCVSEARRDEVSMKMSPYRENAHIPPKEKGRDAFDRFFDALPLFLLRFVMVGLIGVSIYCYVRLLTFIPFLSGPIDYAIVATVLFGIFVATMVLKRMQWM